MLLTYETYAFESSLWFLVIVLVLLYFLFNILSNVVFKLYRPGKRFNNWALNRRVEAAKRDFYQALLDFETGAWEKALKKFKLSAQHIDRPVVACIYAARCAQKLGRKDVREEMLHEAAQLEPKSSLAIGIVRAELLIEEGSMPEAHKVLEGLKQANSGNQQLTSLLAQLPSSNHEEERLHKAGEG